jgi:hypothetical protein
VPRFQTLPDELAVPDELQTSFSSASDTYILIAGCASLLSSGVADPLIVGEGSFVPIAYRTPPARWVLTLTFRHAPNEDARSGVLTALDAVEDLDCMLLYPRLGPHAIADCLVDAGTARLYHAAIGEHSVMGARLRAAVMESGERDPDLLHALGLTDAALPTAGWATRCAQELWRGVCPPELAVDDLPERLLQHSASRAVLMSAAARALSDEHRRGFVRALAANPHFGTLTFPSLGGLVASAMGRAYPDQYRAALALEPQIREQLARDVRLSVAAHDPGAQSVVGLWDAL